MFSIVAGGTLGYWMKVSVCIHYGIPTVEQAPVPTVQDKSASVYVLYVQYMIK